MPRELPLLMGTYPLNLYVLTATPESEGVSVDEDTPAMVSAPPPKISRLTLPLLVLKVTKAGGRGQGTSLGQMERVTSRFAGASQQYFSIHRQSKG